MKKKLILATAILIALGMGGCSQTTKPLLDRALPDSPSFLAPVQTPTVRENQKAKSGSVDLARKFREANKRLEASCLWYNITIKPSFGGNVNEEEVKKICVIKE